MQHADAQQLTPDARPAPAPPPSAAPPEDATTRRVQRLAAFVAAYPDHLVALEAGKLVWKDGTQMSVDDGKGAKAPAALLADADIKDMVHWPYPAGAAIAAPAVDVDPGRARHEPFFDKMYGDCRKGEVQKNLVEVVWLPVKAGQKLKVTRINGVDRAIAAVSRELDALPARFDPYLFPSAGTFNCRTIAGTTQRSVHAHGIAIDIALKHAHYWRWSGTGPTGPIVWRNDIPAEIVAIFEKHGFIWGGRWHHYDTMHFEYRPELIDRALTTSPAPVHRSP